MKKNILYPHLKNDLLQLLTSTTLTPHYNTDHQCHKVAFNFVDLESLTLYCLQKILLRDLKTISLET